MTDELIWLDDKRKIVSEEKATQLIIREVNSKGVMIRETFVSLDPQKGFK